jgi:hypothetical protein
MNWSIIKENPRKYADGSYYLKAERDCSEGTLVLEISFIERFMYDLTVNLHRKNRNENSFFLKTRSLNHNIAV